VKFTRRRLLSVAGVGFASAATYVTLSPEAVAYQASTTVGTQQTVRIEWRETYNGAVVESSADGDRPVLGIRNALPGDAGTVAFRVTPETEGGARVSFSLEVTDTAENEPTEPSQKTTDQQSILDAVQTTAWYDTGSFGVSRLGGCDGNLDTAETTIVDGTLRDADQTLRNGVQLDGCLQQDEEVCVGIAWSLPTTVGNAIQNDRVATTLSFTVEPCETS
jgi:hypothetical protein